ncbi:MAG: mercury resistance system periplasmic binding protein MerP [Rudaea sp.]|uniref:mercury resistance system periplasmic binding protein MerP n=1 Tax=unclassified Rudaea TaxID=2627037 RepID=UPI0010F9262E|nr:MULTISPECIES: mercury resistance system periplasmic binding protein MerP [unclassified Rudaea]MBN8888501.1 mercury resistance system periplasmic binding protein MerP [Rudaea sp.]
MILRMVAALVLLIGSMSIEAASRTVTLSIPGMDCPTCPITIKKALTAVPGVSKAEVRFESRQAAVTFDDSRTAPAELIRVTTDAGYPSKVLEPMP